MSPVFEPVSDESTLPFAFHDRPATTVQQLKKRGTMRFWNLIDADVTKAQPTIGDAIMDRQVSRRVECHFLLLHPVVDVHRPYRKIEQRPIIGPSQRRIQHRQ